MKNGQYRCYKRKNPVLQAPPPNDPIKLNQIPENKQKAEPKPAPIQTPRQHDPFSDIIYYNNQLTEQFNKRLDAVNAELDRLRNKNHKLKGKYKQLKQAVFISDDEEVEEPNVTESSNPPVNKSQQPPEPDPQPIIEQPAEPIFRPPPQRSPAMNFNRFFN